jgi:hypothetical protein
MTMGRTSNVRNLGYLLDNMSNPSFKLDGVDLSNAAEARINLNAWYFGSARSIESRLNGGTWRTFAHPYPQSTDATRAVTLPVDLADLKDGQNTLEMRTSGTSAQPPMVIANVELEVVPK